jgi:cyclopropane fatty-acyl-phospholipid synthase-like methyltransferase
MQGQVERDRQGQARFDFFVRSIPAHLHTTGTNTANHAAKMEFISKLSAPNRPLAEHQAKANEQHYEVPTSFLQLCLGPRMKYSSCFYPSLQDSTRLGGAKDIKYAKEPLGEAEEIMLKSYCEKAGLGEQGEGKGEGLSLLDLGCGWGSLGLYLAEVSSSAFRDMATST